MSSLSSHPILTCDEAKFHEARLLPGEVAEWEAMQRAASSLARALIDDAREIGGLADDARLLVLVGKGHNGGDALLAATVLLEELPLASADIVLVFGSEALRPLTHRALDVLRHVAAARSRELSLDSLKLEFSSYDACLDGVFGFQFRPPLDDAAAELLAWVNTHPRIRLRAAVDLPSGLAEGHRAKTCFRADFTYATGIVKTPLVADDNHDVVGRVRYLDLGFFRPHPADEVRISLSSSRDLPSAQARAGRVLLPSLLRPLGALRPARVDKRTFGHLVVVGGSLHYPGAVLMTVQAALRSGVGLLTACVPEALVPEYAAKFPEVMWAGYAPGSQGGLTAGAVELVREKTARATALVLGPGLGAAPETLAAAEAVVRDAPSAIPLLLDADALRPEIVHAALAAGPRRLVLTPHAGEWQRLGGRAGLRPAEGTSTENEVCAVLKASPTRIEHLSGHAARTVRSETGSTEAAPATPDTYYSFFGGPVLARGGSGDLLAGLIGGRLAQAPHDLLLAAAQGVVWHGLAADLLARDKGQVAVQTTQLLDYLQPALHCTDHEDS